MPPTLRKCHVVDPIMLGGQRVEPGKIVDLTEKEYAYLFRLHAIEPEEVYLARKRAAEIKAKAEAEAARAYDEVMRRESAIADEPRAARPEKFDAEKAEKERSEAARRARQASKPDAKADAS
jgi:hypothetical protein